MQIETEGSQRCARAEETAGGARPGKGGLPACRYRHPAGKLEGTGAAGPGPSGVCFPEKNAASPGILRCWQDANYVTLEARPVGLGRFRPVT